MSDDFKLFCWVEDEEPDQLFSVTVKRGDSGSDLRTAIHAKNVGINARSLKLYKVDKIPLGSFNKDAAKAITLQGDQQLSGGDYISRIWAKGPDPDLLHVVVRLPESDKRKRTDSPASDDVDRSKRARGKSSPVALIDATTAQRHSTVDAIYQRLVRYHLVMVHGTPASGKSTLAQLLAKHIRTEEPTVNPIVISSWPKDGSSWLTKLKTQRFELGRPNTIIIDDAQLAYWDSEFWNSFLKNICNLCPDRVILFVSYGSPNGRTSAESTNMYVPDTWRISLRPESHDQLPKAGLLLSAEEFSEVVEARYANSGFTTDFLDYAFHITAGHVGAVIDLLQIVIAHDSYRQLKDKDRLYSLEIFESKFSIDELWKGLDSTSIFRRGVPRLSELQQPHIAKVFRTVLVNGNVTTKMLDSKGEQDALERCFNLGWLHATANKIEFCYIFTTPLHQWFVEYHLGFQIIDLTLITDPDLFTFVFEVLKRFSPTELSSPRKISASNVQRPPEAQLQDEFYRCCHSYSKGSLISFPEYGGTRDFYIPLKKWGVELLRDRDELVNHSSRFMGTGAYAQMDLEDYIILDFRKTQPQKKHTGIPKLFHVIFKDDFQRIEIQTGSLETLKEFELLNC